MNGQNFGRLTLYTKILIFIEQTAFFLLQIQKYKKPFHSNNDNSETVISKYSHLSCKQQFQIKRDKTL